MRVRKRDIKAGLVFYQCKGVDIQTLNRTDCGRDEEEFMLVNPLRVNEDGVIDTLSFLEEVNSKDYQVNSLYVEVEDESLYLSSPDMQSPVFNWDDNDHAKYLYMGSQQWIVYNTTDPKHKFRKTITFLLGRSFDKECERRDKIEKQKEEKGLPIPKSISYEDYQRKDKRINKNFRNDDFNSLF